MLFGQFMISTPHRRRFLNDRGGQQEAAVDAEEDVERGGVAGGSVYQQTEG